MRPDLVQRPGIVQIHGEAASRAGPAFDPPRGAVKLTARVLRISTAGRSSGASDVAPTPRATFPPTGLPAPRAARLPLELSRMVSSVLELAPPTTCHEPDWI